MKIVKVLLSSFVIIYLMYKVFIFFKIDSCLDQGGAWDYPKNICISDDNISLNEIKCLSERGTWNSNMEICVR